MLSIQASVYLGTAYESFGDVTQYLWSILHIYSDVLKYALQKRDVIAIRLIIAEQNDLSYPGN